MKTFLYVLITMLLAGAATGCSGDKERGMNRPDKTKDLPRAAPTESHK